MFFGLLGKIGFSPGHQEEGGLFQPFVLDKGTTVVEAAAEIHKEIAANLKYARGVRYRRI